MREYKIMSLVIKYIKQNRKSAVLFSMFAFIFTIVLSLYNLPIVAVGYAVLLCTFIGVIFVIYDFIQFYRKHKTLCELQNRISLSTIDLPQSVDLLEQDYQELIKTVFREKMQLAFNADNARSELVDYYTMWVHQIKTPISAMGLLLQSEENEQNSELLMELFKIEQYVEMVLQYLRIDSTSSDFVLKRYSLDEIVRQAVRKYAKMFIRKKISLNYSELDCKVLTDEKWLLFVIEQLLSNALKYTKEGQISIYMDNREKATLVIQDTGIGIAGEDIPRVFEKGYTGYNGRRDKKSSGLGLYLCKSVLKKLSHTITIESEVGKGTKILIGLDTVDITFE